MQSDVYRAITGPYHTFYLILNRNRCVAAPVVMGFGPLRCRWRAGWSGDASLDGGTLVKYGGGWRLGFLKKKACWDAMLMVTKPVYIRCRAFCWVVSTSNRTDAPYCLMNARNRVRHFSTRWKSMIGLVTCTCGHDSLIQRVSKATSQIHKRNICQPVCRIMWWTPGVVPMCPELKAWATIVPSTSSLVSITLCCIGKRWPYQQFGSTLSHLFPERFVVSKFAWPELTVSGVQKPLVTQKGSCYLGSIYQSLPVAGVQSSVWIVIWTNFE